MAVNSSSAVHPSDCFNSAHGAAILTAFQVTRFLLLGPPSVFVIHLALQRWRRQRSFADVSHADVFSYHSAAVELIYALGAACYVCGQYSGVSELTWVSYGLFPIVFLGETSFHMLMCAERYLAVVHPVLYLELKRSGRGVKTRNISVGCVWLLCVAWMGVTVVYFPYFAYIPYFCFIVLALVATSFFSLSVLCVLVRPGPGGAVVDRTRVGRSKRRAFHTVMVIMGVLWLYFIGYLVGIFLEQSKNQNYAEHCAIILLANLATLPSSLVLPLLFLHRAVSPRQQ